MSRMALLFVYIAMIGAIPILVNSWIISVLFLGLKMEIYHDKSNLWHFCLIWWSSWATPWLLLIKFLSCIITESLATGISAYHEYIGLLLAYRDDFSCENWNFDHFDPFGGCHVQPHDPSIWFFAVGSLQWLKQFCPIWWTPCVTPWPLNNFSDMHQCIELLATSNSPFHEYV